MFCQGNVHNIEAVRDAFKSGEGVAYQKAHPCCFQGTAGFLSHLMRQIY